MKINWTILTIIAGTVAVSAGFRLYPEYWDAVLGFVDRYTFLVLAGLTLFFGWSFFLIRQHGKNPK